MQRQSIVADLKSRVGVALVEVVDDQSLVGIEGLDLRGDDGVHAEIQRLNVNIPSSLETSLNQNLNIVMPVVYLAAKKSNKFYIYPHACSPNGGYRFEYADFRMRDER